MSVLEIKSSKRTPYVKFDTDKGTLEIKGCVLLFNPTNFFDELLELIDEYLLAPQEHTQVLIQIEYFNTYASKLLLFILKKLQKVLKQNLSVSMIWLYDEDDEEMSEVGEHYKSSLKMQTSIESIAV
jgi:hypothetical protein